MSDWTVIIPAGGMGKRMSSAIPKQLMLLVGKPLLCRTIETLHAGFNAPQIVVALPSDWMDQAIDWCNTFTPHIPIDFVVGGTERYHSVQNALNVASGQFVAVHDAVRPFVDKDTMQRLMASTEQKGSAVPVVPLVDSLRQIIDEENSRSVNRADYVAVQTPQCFSLTTLKQAYQQAFSERITDDASLVEGLGIQIHMVQGNIENIKITTPMDWELAQQRIENDQTT